MLLLAVALCLPAAGPASAAGSGDEMVISVGQSASLDVVSTAQSDGETDTEPGTDLRMVERESGERVDAVVIALWTIAGVMTVLLGFFLWHTSPRRRLRLAGGSAGLLGEAGEDSEVAGRKPGEDAGDEDSVAGVLERILAWTRLRGMRPQDAGPADDDSQPAPVEGSENESAVWKFNETDSDERSV